MLAAGDIKSKNDMETWHFQDNFPYEKILAHPSQCKFSFLEIQLPFYAYDFNGSHSRDMTKGLNGGQIVIKLNIM